MLAVVVLLVRRRYRRALALLIGSGCGWPWAMLALDRLLVDRALVERVRADTGGEVELTDPGFATSPHRLGGGHGGHRLAVADPLVAPGAVGRGRRPGRAADGVVGRAGVRRRPRPGGGSGGGQRRPGRHRHAD